MTTGQKGEQGIFGDAFRTRIGRRVLALFIGCALVPVLALAGLSLASVSSSLREAADESLRRATKAAGMTLVERLQMLAADLDVARGAVLRDGAAGLAHLSAQVRERIEGRFAWVAILRGGFAEPLLGQGAAALTLTEDEVGHLAAGKTLVRAASRGAGVAVVQALDPAEAVAGWIIGVASGRSLWESDGVRPEIGELTVLDAAGSVLFDSSPEPVPRKLLAWVRDGDESAARLEWPGGGGDVLEARAWRVFMRPAFLAEWVVVHARPRSSVLAPLRGFQRLFVLTVVATVLLVVVLGLIQIRRTLGPITRLHEATRRIACGDLTVKVGIERDDEFGDLGRSFDEMTRELVENIRRRERTERELVVARDEALAAARTEAAFLTNVSHEFRTPLTGILSSAEILREFADDDPEAQREFTGVILEQGQLLTRLVEDVIEMSRLTRGDVELAGHGIQVETTIRAALARVGEVSRQRVELRIEDGLPRLDGDAAYLERLWFHLIDNALKFGPEGTSVVVAAREVPDGVVVEVVDQGPGVATEDHGLIFERFRQAGQDTLTDKTPGTGLGLSLAQAIVARHHGRIEVDSQPGCGATFRVVLPAVSTAVSR